MVDRLFSFSSFLALRYTEKSGVDFSARLKYRYSQMPSDEDCIL